MRRVLTIVVTAAAVSLPLIGGAATAVAAKHEKGPFSTLSNCNIARNATPVPTGPCHKHTTGRKGYYFSVV